MIDPTGRFSLEEIVDLVIVAQAVAWVGIGTFYLAAELTPKIMQWIFCAQGWLTGDWRAQLICDVQALPQQ